MIKSPRRAPSLAVRVALCLIAVSSPSLALRANASNITVGSPTEGSSSSYSVLIRAHNTGCDGQAPVSFGYSLDSEKEVNLGETPYDIDVTSTTIPTGKHTLVFKSWVKSGECPTVRTSFSVEAGSKPTPYSIPSYAQSSGDLDGSSKWTQTHDGGTPGKSVGKMVYPAKTPAYDDAREFNMTYTAQAGERWGNQFVRDTEATNFVLDTYVLLPKPSEVMNLELDINQTLANDETVILSTQCSGKIGVWEYGYTEGAHDHWKSTNIKCNPATWTANVWHHIQIGEHREANGVVTHDWVAFDGVYTPFKNATLVSAHFLKWFVGDINTQVQIEGSSPASGTATAYIHKLTIYRWVAQ